MPSCLNNIFRNCKDNLCWTFSMNAYNWFRHGRFVHRVLNRTRNNKESLYSWTIVDCTGSPDNRKSLLRQWSSGIVAAFSCLSTPSDKFHLTDSSSLWIRGGDSLQNVISVFIYTVDLIEMKLYHNQIIWKEELQSVVLGYISRNLLDSWTSDSGWDPWQGLSIPTVKDRRPMAFRSRRLAYRWVHLPLTHL